MAQKHVDPVDPDPQHCLKEVGSGSANLYFTTFQMNCRRFLILLHSRDTGLLTKVHNPPGKRVNDLRSCFVWLGGVDL
jgi:hypothetical protein